MSGKLSHSYLVSYFQGISSFKSKTSSVLSMKHQNFIETPFLSWFCSLQPQIPSKFAQINHPLRPLLRISVSSLYEKIFIKIVFYEVKYRIANTT